MFTRSIVKKPGKSMTCGLSSAGLGTPDYTLACSQHAAYIAALESCGCEVTVLDSDEEYPDSTFVEDTALLLREAAIITPSGAPSRKGEAALMKHVLTRFYEKIEEIIEPGTVDSGDIMKVGMHFFIGLSKRTNRPGADALIQLLRKYGYSGSTVAFDTMLHLKTGVAYLEQNRMVAAGEFINKPDFKGFEIIPVAPEEAYAANCIWVNGTVILPDGFPKIADAIEKKGYKTIRVDLSEFRKLDGGASCLSLRF